MRRIDALPMSMQKMRSLVAKAMEAAAGVGG